MTRAELPRAAREIATVAILVAMGPAERQLASHAAAALRAGVSASELLALCEHVARLARAGSPWEPVMGRLAIGRRVFAYDIRSHGWAAGSPATFTMADTANDLFGVLDALGLDRAHVVGQSYGGAIAQTAASAAPSGSNRWRCWPLPTIHSRRSKARGRPAGLRSIQRLRPAAPAQARPPRHSPRPDLDWHHAHRRRRTSAPRRQTRPHHTRPAATHRNTARTAAPGHRGHARRTVAAASADQPARRSAAHDRDEPPRPPTARAARRSLRRGDPLPTSRRPTAGTRCQPPTRSQPARRRGPRHRRAAYRRGARRELGPDRGTAGW